MARLVGGSYNPTTTTDHRRLLTFARGEAGRRFCPAQRAHPGTHSTEEPVGAGRMPYEDHVHQDDTALEDWAITDELTRRIGRDVLAVGYLDLLTMPLEARSGGAAGTWPYPLDCGLLDSVLEGRNTDETARNVNDLQRWPATRQTRQELDRSALEASGSMLDALAQNEVGNCSS